jgi:hypothetical protein
MKKLVLFFGICLMATFTMAQDLNCTVDVITTRIQASNKQIFEDFKNTVTQFVNNKKWIAEDVNPNEKIDCAFVFEFREFNIDQFEATLNIQSSRTIYGTNYNSKIFNYVDNDCKFQYAQFQQMEFQENSYTSNITSILGFYINIIIGLDFDTYKLYGGTSYFKKAQAVRDAAMNSASGWQSNDGAGNRNRYFLIDNLLDSRFSPFRDALYRYHMKGLDKMTSDIDKGREEVYTSLQDLKKVYDAMPNAFILRIWFNAKSDEIIEIFKQGSPTQKNKAVDLLKKMDPANRSRYEDGILKS